MRLKNILFISIISLVLAHFLVTTYFPNLAVNLTALLIISYFLYENTLKKNDFFSFLMVIYICSAFPILQAKGGGFNLVTFVTLLIYFIATGKFPFYSVKDRLAKLFITILILSSILGWIFNYAGEGINIVYSIISFFGVIFLLLLSQSIDFNHERIALFIKINVIILFYALFVTVNRYLSIVNIETLFLPGRYLTTENFIATGIVGTSPVYGEFSMLCMTMFIIFYLSNIKYLQVKKKILLLGSLLAGISIIASISRSVFLLALLGLLLITITQFLLRLIKLNDVIKQLVVIFFFSLTVLFISNATGLDRIFYRFSQYEDTVLKEDGISKETIFGGKALNREAAFKASRAKYHSRDNWLIGYGWGLTADNRKAFYVDTSIKRGSAHSQIFAVLFLFGWCGTIGYWGLFLRVIYLSYKRILNKKLENINLYFAFFSMIGFFLLLLNEIKVDNISVPNYFAMTMILLGLAYANVSKLNRYIL
ncbi:MAG: hypothetical protein ACOXZV_04740 [Bacteroidales bacterium]